MKYFTSVSDYQVPYREDNPFPYGHLYQYVASWVLDGIVNYPERIAGAVLACYSEDEELPDVYPARQSCQELRQKVMSWNNKSDGWCGSLYETFGDNVVLLSYEETTDAYWFFYFDCDSSDCSIGRFKTTDSREEVLNEFKRWLEDMVEHDDCQGWIPLKVERLTSWVEW